MAGLIEGEHAGGDPSPFTARGVYAGIRAAGYCHLYCLQKEAFDQVLEGHPGFARHMHDIVRQRQTEIIAEAFSSERKEE